MGKSGCPGKPRNNTGQPKWEPWLLTGHLCFSGMKMKHDRNTDKCQCWAVKMRYGRLPYGQPGPKAICPALIITLSIEGLL